MTYDTFTGIIGVDIETSSAVDIKVGAWAYSQHPSTIALCVVFCYSTGKRDAKRYVTWESGELIPPAVVEFIAAGGKLLAHNRSFEIAIWKHVLQRMGFPPVADDQWLDTQPIGLAVNLPASLDGLAHALGCPIQKDAEGKKLMLSMCKARPGYADDMAEFDLWIHHEGDDGWIYPHYYDTAKRERLVRYCADDVGAMLDCYWRLPKLSVTESLVLAADHEINCRGMFLDQNFARQCASMARKRKAELDDEAFSLTAGELANSRSPNALKTWLKEHGVTLPTKTTRLKQGDGTYKSATSETTDKGAVAVMLDDPDLRDEVRAILLNRTESNKVSSFAKLDRIPDMVGHDGRLRNALAYSATGPGRWSSYGLQVHNLTKDKMGPGEGSLVRLAIELGDLDLLKFSVDQPLDAISQCVRSVVAAEPGFDLVAADWSAIQARIVAWLAGQDDILDVFERGEDVYVYNAAQFDMVGCGRGSGKAHTATCPVCTEHRHVGKAATLGLGFQMGALTFSETGAKAGIDLPLKRWRQIQRGWRKANHRIAAFWPLIEDACRDAIENVGMIFRAGDHIQAVATTSCLFVRLPSGRSIRYWNPRIVKTTKKIKTVNEEGEIVESEMTVREIQFRTAKGAMMVDESTYGGKLTENVTMGVERDILAETLLRVRGVDPYDVMIHVHDSAAAQVPEGAGDVREFERLLEVVPTWATGLPLKAEGYRDKRFRG